MMIRKLVTARIALTLGLSLTVLACTDDDESQDGASEAEETDGDGDGDTGEADAGDGDSGDGDGDSGDGDSGELDLVEEGCAAGCALIAECYFPVPDCMQLCVEAHQDAGECFDEQLDVTLCVANLDCEQYEALMNGEPGVTCAEENAANDACGVDG